MADIFEALSLQGSTLSTGSNLNVASPVTLEFDDPDATEGGFDPRYFAFDNATDPEGIEVLVAGDYLVCLNLPAEVSTALVVANQRVRLEVEVQVNGSPVADAVSRNCFIRQVSSGGGATDERGCARLYFFLSGLSANDVVSFDVGGIASTSNTVAVHESWHVAMWALPTANPDKGVISTKFSECNPGTPTTDFDQGTAQQIIFTTPDREDSEFTWDGGDPEIITTEEDLLYIAFLNCPLTSTAARASVAFTAYFDTGGGAVALDGGPAQDGYIRNANSDDESTVAGIWFFEGTGDFTLEVNTEGATGTAINTGSEEGQLTIIAIPRDAIFAFNVSGTAAGGGTGTWVPATPTTLSTLIPQEKDDDLFDSFPEGTLTRSEWAPTRDCYLWMFWHVALERTSGTGIRQMIQMELLRNGSNIGLGHSTYNAYIRDANNHFESSASLGLITRRLDADDVLAVGVQSAPAGDTTSVVQDENDLIGVSLLVPDLKITSTTVTADDAEASVSAQKVSQAPQLGAFIPSTGIGQLTDPADPAYDINTAGGHTFEVWVKFDSWVQNAEVFARWTITNQKYRLYVSAAGTLRFQVFDGSGTFSTGVNNLLLNTWLHVLVEIDYTGEELTMVVSYGGTFGLGGSSNNAATGMSASSGGGLLRVGASGSVPLTGIDATVCRFRKYDTTISPATAEILYNEGRGVPYSIAALLSPAFAFEMDEPAPGGVTVARLDSVSETLALLGTAASAGGTGTVMVSDPATADADTTKVIQDLRTIVADFNGSTSQLVDTGGPSNWRVQSGIGVHVFWIRPTALSASGSFIFGIWDGTAGGSQIRYYLDATGDLHVEWTDGSVDYDFDTGINFTLDEWVMVSIDWQTGVAAELIRVSVSRRSIPNETIATFSTSDQPNNTPTADPQWGVDPAGDYDPFEGQMSRWRLTLAFPWTDEIIEDLYNCGHGLRYVPFGFAFNWILPGGNTLFAYAPLEEVDDTGTEVTTRYYWAGGEAPPDPSVAAGSLDDTDVASAELGWGTVVCADGATVAVSIQRVEQVDVAVTADAATTAIDADRIIQTDVAVTAGAATTIIAAQRLVYTDVALSADAATAAVDADTIRQTDVAVAAGNATAAVDATVIRQTSVAVEADPATTAIDADRIIQTDIAVEADDATAAIVGEVLGGVDADVDADAGNATTAIDADRIIQTAVTVSATVATTTVDADTIRQTSVAVEADPATTAIDADVIRQTDATVEADAATTTIAAQRVVQTTTAVTADPATTSIDVSRVEQVDVAVAADAATVAIDIDKISQTTLALDQGAATTAIDVSVGVIQTDVAVTADAATTAIDADRIIQTDIAVEADPATASIDADSIRQTDVAVQAGVATTSIDAQKVSQTDAAVAADPATTSIATQYVRVVAVTLTADPATTAIDAQRISQTDATVAADPAATAVDADRIVQTDVALDQGAATAAIDAQLYVFTSVAVAAQDATAAVAAQRVVQTVTALQAGAATASVDAEVQGATTASVAAQADAATATALGQRISQGSVSGAAGAAETAVGAQRVVQTAVALSADAATASATAGFLYLGTLAVEAGAATVATDLSLIRQTDLALSAEEATAAVLAQRIVQVSATLVCDAASFAIDADFICQTTLALEQGAATAAIVGEIGRSDATVVAIADPATAAIDAERVFQTDVALAQGEASAQVLAQRVVQTTVALQAAPATAVATGSVVQTQADVAAQADAATASIVGQRIVQTDATVEADPASTQVLAQKVAQSTVDADADGATTTVQVGKTLSGNVNLAAALAQAQILAQRIVQTDVAVAQGEVRFRATDAVLIFDLDTPTITAYRPRTDIPVVAPLADVDVYFTLPQEQQAIAPPPEVDNYAEPDEEIQVVAPRSELDVFFQPNGLVAITAPTQEFDVFAPPSAPIDIVAPVGEVDVYFNPATMQHQTQVALVADAATAQISGTVA